MGSGHSLDTSTDPRTTEPDGIKVRIRPEPASSPTPETNSYAGLGVIMLIVASILSGSVAAGLPRPLRQIFEFIAIVSLLGATLTAWRAARRLDSLESEPEPRSKVAQMNRSELPERSSRRSGRDAA